MPKIFINEKPIQVDEGITVLQACEISGNRRFHVFVITKDCQLQETAECALLKWKTLQNQ